MISAQLTKQLATALEADAPASRHFVPAHLRRVVLTGFMGAGKSTVGRLLARQLNWDFLDLDQFLEARTNSTIPELFSMHGEPHFRRLESTALASALGRTSTVLALGGGTPEVLTNRLLLEQTPGTFTIFLDASFETLFDRCILQDIERPVLADVDEARFRFSSRQPSYRRLAHHTFNTEMLTSEETVAALLLLIGKVTPPRC